MNRFAKKTIWAWSALGGAALFAIPDSQPKEQFMATVQIAVQEKSPELTQRGRKIVVDQVSSAFNAWPALEGKSYELQQKGNEVVLTLTTKEDMQAPVEQAVYHMIENLNGRVRAYGRSRFYRTRPSERLRGYLKVAVQNSMGAPAQIRSISATSVFLRDVLRELQRKVGSFSYLVPGECMNRTVSWSFGEGGQHKPKDLDSVMTELATFLSLKNEKRNETYIFTGSCNEMPEMVKQDQDNLNNVLSVSFPPRPEAKTIPTHQSVYIPLMPLSR